MVSNSSPALRHGRSWTIAVTEFDDETVRERALNAGFNLYLPKRVDPRMLAPEIARRVSRR